MPNINPTPPPGILPGMYFTANGKTYQATGKTTSTESNTTTLPERYYIDPTHHRIYTDKTPRTNNQTINVPPGTPPGGYFTKNGKVYKLSGEYTGYEVKPPDNTPNWWKQTETPYQQTTHGVPPPLNPVAMTLAFLFSGFSCLGPIVGIVFIGVYLQRIGERNKLRRELQWRSEWEAEQRAKNR